MHAHKGSTAAPVAARDGGCWAARARGVGSVRRAMGGSTVSFLLDWNPGIGDRERGAQPLVEFSRRLSAVPSAPGECACFVFGAGRDHQAQSGLGVLDVPVRSLWRVRRHGDLPCGCPSGTPALRRSPPCVPGSVPASSSTRPPHTAAPRCPCAHLRLAGFCPAGPPASAPSLRLARSTRSLRRSPGVESPTIVWISSRPSAGCAWEGLRRRERLECVGAVL